MTFPELFFYAEAEGLLPTRAGKINAIINEVKAYPNSEIDFFEFEKILTKYGLKYNNLSNKEIRYINASIR